uniref:Uncharacterized protein n=1 Tax=Ananas comosus var. bracteatus TaxID=296719 RepID=A0A6V7PGZ6_ANACO|nr:unnamed protein product [Ananas comosus var. bracteatus]
MLCGLLLSADVLRIGAVFASGLLHALRFLRLHWPSSARPDTSEPCMVAMAVATLSSILRTSSFKALKVSAISVYLSPTFDRMSSNSARRSSTDAESFVIRVSLPLPRLEGCLEASPPTSPAAASDDDMAPSRTGSDTNCHGLNEFARKSPCGARLPPRSEQACLSTC